MCARKCKAIRRAVEHVFYVDTRLHAVVICEKHFWISDIWPIWEFPKIRGVPHFGVLIIRILKFRVQNYNRVPFFLKLPYGYIQKYTLNPQP